MQIDDLLRRVESLPPLPRTIILIEEYRRKSEKEISELHDIISKDALIVTNLLKIANSAMFGFRSKVETPLRAISLLGINFTISVAISASSQKLLVTTLAPYGLTNDNFMNSSNIASVLASLWLGKIDETIKDEIILPALLIDIGKYIIADMILNEQKEKEFKAQIEEGILSIEEVEKEFLGFSSSYVTAQIFKHWKLSPNLINSIEFVDDINSVSKEFERKAKILSVIKTVANIKEPLSEKSIKEGIIKAKEYGFDTKILAQTIENLKTKIDLY
ncbi:MULTISPECIES: HDOD domain-containing protein [Aliarcobacter]|uniref:HDOD domain-containing protein n=3 Tax=Arcobacteraceae TaxID=2808963 RepID=A0A1V9VD92_9BACT|nr:HDOD domain-containing protein [Aliarcobacter cryaerophilus]OQA74130.1 MAG: HDOD domain protein [Candidatus Dependentiae bacterium ADurb.Bin246]WNL11641.1 HDOD domain-containing protein [Arcobacter sp. AZ-2023]WPD10253.1 HDOD domain-containing protein [Arcobacter sp. DSM 115954]AYJ78476.1 HDOD domain-containing protein [Aliarcobacter cryaerophilus D2610]MCT7405656.1 HDOD domain-containing protein [Aliarcobacter cryaerophilus]